MKYPRQKKSRTYYYFWAFMALTVFFGQLVCWIWIPSDAWKYA